MASDVPHRSNLDDDINDPESLAVRFRQAIKVLKQYGMEGATEVPVSAIHFNPFDPVGGLLSALDGALKEVDDAKASGLKIAFMGNGDATFAAQEMEAWRDLFTEAFEKKLFEITTSPVSKLDGSLLHKEANLVLRRPSERLTGGQFLPWIATYDGGHGSSGCGTGIGLHRCKSGSNFGQALSGGDSRG